LGTWLYAIHLCFDISLSAEQVLQSIVRPEPIERDPQPRLLAAYTDALAVDVPRYLG